jgi:hypothetical protein
LNPFIGKLADGEDCPSFVIALDSPDAISLTTALYLVLSISAPDTAGKDAPGGEKLPEPLYGIVTPVN